MSIYTITLPARQFEGDDDCLAAAEAQYIAQHPELRGWDLDPRWGDDDRETILLDVPA